MALAAGGRQSHRHMQEFITLQLPMGFAGRWPPRPWTTANIYISREHASLFIFSNPPGGLLSIGHIVFFTYRFLAGDPSPSLDPPGGQGGPVVRRGSPTRCIRRYSSFFQQCLTETSTAVPYCHVSSKTFENRYYRLQSSLSK